MAGNKDTVFIFLLCAFLFMVLLRVEAGICLWYRDGYTVSLSMRGDVNMEELESMFQFLNHSLIIG